MKKRIRAIVKHTLKDFSNAGSHFDEKKKKSIKWISDDIFKIEGLEDLSTIEVSLLTLKRLNSLDLVDIENINKIIAGEKYD